jgi:hypothetical protein
MLEAWLELHRLRGQLLSVLVRDLLEAADSTLYAKKYRHARSEQARG